MTMRDVDVLILGGGVIGLACAYYLLGEGRSVTVLDQGRVGGGSSHGNCGTLTPSHATPLAMPGVLGAGMKWLLQADAPLRIKPRFDPALIRWLLRFSAHCNWQDFARITAAKAPFLVRSRDLIASLVADEQIDCDFRQLGTLYVYRDQRAFAASTWLPRALGEVGIDIETLTGSEVESREPALRDGVVGGYFNPGDASLRPDRYVAGLAQVVRARGGVIEEHTRVLGVERHGERVSCVHTDKGDFRGRDVVLALGAWSPQLARELGISLPIQPGKGYSITYARPASCPRVPLVLKEPSVCVTAWHSGYRLGSTMEFAGYDSSLNRTRIDALKRGASAYLRDPEGPLVEEEWYGWRPMTPDDLPFIGPASAGSNLCLATGHGMLGMTMSALTGVLVSELLTGKPTSLDVSPFRVDRFR